MDQADEEYATKVASLLLSSFPNQPHDPKTFLRQLVIALIGRPRENLKAMVDPRKGYLARERFPTIAGVNEWLDARNIGQFKGLEFRPELPKITNAEWKSRRLQ